MTNKQTYLNNNNIIIIIMNIVALFFLNSCATGYVKRSIAKETSIASELKLYDIYKFAIVNGQPHKMSATYVGFIEKEGHKYYGIALDNVRSNLARQKVLLLIPSDNSANPILEEYITERENLINNVEVVVEYVPMGIQPKQYKYFYNKYGWDEYPRSVSVGFDNHNPYLPNMWAIYRFGNKEQDIESKVIIDHLAWGGRSKIKYYGLKMLLPVAGIFDAVTSPIQFLLWLFYFHV